MLENTCMTQSLAIETAVTSIHINMIKNKDMICRKVELCIKCELENFREQLKMKRTRKHELCFAKTEQQMPRRPQQ